MSEEYGPIPQHPPGLLGFLQIKNMGRNPYALVSTYQPVLDMSEWLLMNDVIVLGATNVGGVTDNFTEFQDAGVTARVPQNEWWLVHDFNVNLLGLATGDVAQMAPAFQVNTNLGGDTLVVGHDSRISVSATQASLVAFSTRTPFFAPPNSLFGAWIYEANVAAARNLGVRLRYTPLPV